MVCTSFIGDFMELTHTVGPRSRPTGVWGFRDCKQLCDRDGCEMFSIHHPSGECYLVTDNAETEQNLSYLTYVRMKCDNVGCPGASKPSMKQNEGTANPYTCCDCASDAKIKRQDGSSTLKCELCETGKAPTWNRSTCELCGPRHYSQEGYPQCFQCDHGQISDKDTGGTKCVTCKLNEYASADNKCTACGFFEYVNDARSACIWEHIPVVISAAVLTFAFTSLLLYRRLNKWRWARWRADISKLQVKAQQGDVEAVQGLWHFKANNQFLAELEKVRKTVKSDSERLGVSSLFVRNEYEDISNMIMNQEVWRVISFRDQEFTLTLSGCIQLCKSGSQEEPPAEWHQGQAAPVPEDPDFLTMGPVVASGAFGIGVNHLCPRDGHKGASICDALRSRGQSEKANRFLSWVWQYRRSTMLSALRRYSIEHPDDHENKFYWWCYFCNNQYRILQEHEEQSTETLAEIFGGRLRGVGRMMMCMDKPTGSLYTSRIWCIFELFVARMADIPCQVVLPEDVKIDESTDTSVRELVDRCKVDSEAAQATNKKDEDGIKKLIGETSSFESVDRVVEEALWKEMIKMMEAANKRIQANSTIEAEHNADELTYVVSRL
eukprot:TRINITY_DN3746_c0_g1_i9.p1 TRINITY_DN3746_c0_g1~~TRINITY_DN3746_c0_g1_i9.p1  ORF type:complete len:607 (-),score=90.70 TRINITY_DN3746_c0_g1_i9:41-1861(-)